MSTYTTNYNLKKPEGGDAVNIGDINGNMDTVDEQLKANADGLLQTYTKAQMDAFISTINGNISTGDAARYTKTESDGRYSPTSHTHDSRYYTESEMDTKLSGKSDAGHNHDSRYPLIGHTHDDRYYTEAEADSRFAATSHTHDDRYYTESEIDSKISDITIDTGFVDITSQVSLIISTGTVVFCRRIGKQVNMRFYTPHVPVYLSGINFFSFEKGITINGYAIVPDDKYISNNNAFYYVGNWFIDKSSQEYVYGIKLYHSRTNNTYYVGSKKNIPDSSTSDDIYGELTYYCK